MQTSTSWARASACGQVVAIVGGDQRNARLAREPHQLRIDAVLFLHPLVLELQEEVPFAENVAQIVGRLARGFVAVGSQRHSHLSAQAGRERDQAVGVASQQVFINARLVVIAFDVGRGGELHQVAVAALVFAEQHEVVGAVGISGSVEPAGGRNVDFAADNRLDVALLRGLVKLYGAKKIAVVGHRHGRHFQLRGAVHQLADFARTVEQTVVGMKMQMNKILGSHAD